jgi:hypothetical protein
MHLNLGSKEIVNIACGQSSSMAIDNNGEVSQHVFLFTVIVFFFMNARFTKYSLLCVL